MTDREEMIEERAKFLKADLKAIAFDTDIGDLIEIATADVDWFLALIKPEYTDNGLVDVKTSWYLTLEPYCPMGTLKSYGEEVAKAQLAKCLKSQPKDIQLPDMKSVTNNFDDFVQAYNTGWNECLETVKKLNGVKHGN